MARNYVDMIGNNGSNVITDTITSPEQEDAEIRQLMEQLALTRFIVLKILMPLVVTFGVVGNILNISVLTRRWMRSSTNYYLTALAFCDVLYLLLAFSLLFDKYDPMLAESRYYVTYKHMVGIPFTNTWSNAGVCVTLTFTVERYIGVCHPMKGKRWCTPRLAKYIIIGVFFGSALLTLPFFFTTRVTMVTQGNKTIPERNTTAFGEHPAYKIGYTWFNQTLFAFLPLCLLLIFNTMLIQAVTVASNKRQKMSGLQTTAHSDRQLRHQREQHKITVMLIVVVMVFLICQLPQAVVHIVWELMCAKNLNTMKVTLRVTIVNNICNLLVMINASINFVLYSSFSLKFRRTFRLLFCRCLWRHNRAPVHFIFSEVFSTVDTKNGVTRTTKGTASPFASSPIRHANSYVSINVNVNLTPAASPTPSVKGTYVVNNKSSGPSRNGYLAVNQMDKFV